MKLGGVSSQVALEFKKRQQTLQSREEQSDSPKHKNEEIVKQMKADVIAKQIARGKYVTDEEREQVKQIEPDKLTKADLANEHRVFLQSQLKKTTSKDEAKRLVLHATALTTSHFQSDIDFGSYKMEAIQQAEENYFTKNKKRESTFTLTSKLKHFPIEPRFDQRL